MRVLHVSERFGGARVGGAQRSVELLARAHAATGIEVGVICVQDSSEPAEHSRYPFPVFRIPISRVNRSMRRPKLNGLVSAAYYLYDGNVSGCSVATRRAIAEFQPDIINTHILTGISDTIWRIARSNGITTVHTLRDYYALCARSSMFKRDDACASPCVECRLVTMRRRRLIRHVDGIVGISERLVQIHRENAILAPTQPVEVIPNSVDFEPARCADRSRDKEFVVGFLGRIVPTKGVEQLLAAFVHAGMSGARLLIAGEGPPRYLNALRRRAAGQAVEFVGQCDAQAFYGQCDVIAIPSLWEEPFGRVVAEALLMAVPVICSDRGAFPEILRRFPGGMTTRPEDAPQFADTLRTMRTEHSRYRQLLESRRKEIARYFSSDLVADRYARFYRSFRRTPF